MTGEGFSSIVLDATFLGGLGTVSSRDAGPRAGAGEVSGYLLPKPASKFVFDLVLKVLVSGLTSGADID